MKKILLIIFVLSIVNCSLEKVLIEGKKRIKKIIMNEGKDFVMKRGKQYIPKGIDTNTGRRIFEVSK